MYVRRPLRSRKARKNATKKICKGGRKKRPAIWCEQRFDNAKSCLCRANCPVAAVLCACYRCYVLIGSTGVICVGEKTGGRERSNTCRRKSSTPYTTTRIIPGTALCLKESAQRSNTAPQRRARHRTARLRTAPHGSARRYAALLGHI